jgi:hypothetical protein
MADVLELLRPLMDSHSPPLHALVVPSEDYHQVCVAHSFALPILIFLLVGLFRTITVML